MPTASAGPAPATEPAPVPGHDLVTGHTVYACVMGSRAFGLATGASDTDRRGVYLAPTALFWRFEKPPAQVEGPRPEEFSWELERFCELALRANPTALECLHSPLVEHADATGRELLALRGAFLSREVHGVYVRYAAGRHKQLRADAGRRGAPRWKQVMHLLRMLTCARDLLRTGRLTLDVGAARAELLAVRRGEVAWEAVERRLAVLAEEAEAALPGSPLPAGPDRARVADFLHRTRRASALGA
ncbi:nucleotidyltransferase domain-containing protein [Streptomyces sp. RS10V-4]|uniref:nucleotidyltransferase domain-containing protein n=1 Tax=Streptomyces rhizoryzae TaxID=2932493 RepID=UPI002003B48D|nr:nucleotidyltransferase domain-containing protein [Streptomyces rhizoryzae]MCK7623227.1 nucleotidyltransferase domain-containing protein [Streptomyces rhizoryzae]